MEDDLFEIELNLLSTKKILGQLGIGENGAAQYYFANTLMRAADPYVPFQSSMLKNSVRVTDKGTALSYNTPYARLHWYGRVMVDPVYNKAAFFNPNYGYWSRPGIPKVVDPARKYNYNGAPKRGSFWVLRAWIDNKDSITAGVAKFIESRM